MWHIYIINICKIYQTLIFILGVYMCVEWEGGISRFIQFCERLTFTLVEDTQRYTFVTIIMKNKSGIFLLLMLEEPTKTIFLLKYWEKGWKNLDAVNPDSYLKESTFYRRTAKLVWYI